MTTRQMKPFPGTKVGTLGAALKPLAPFAATVMFLQACSCDSEPTEVLPGVTILRPTDKATLKLADDEDVSSVGIQYSVEANLSNLADGSTASLLIDGAPVEGQSQTVAVASGAKEVKVTFAKPTLPAGAHAVSVKVVDKGSGKTAADTRDVTVETAVTEGCEFVSPADGSTLRATDDVDAATAGVQADVKVKCTNVAPGVPVKLSVVAPAALGGQVRAVAGTFTYAADGVTFPKVSLGEGGNTLRFEATPAGSAAVLKTSSVTVDTGKCAVWLTDKGGVIYNLAGQAAPQDSRQVIADIDSALAGVQARLVAKVDATRCPAGSTATLELNGAASGTATVAADGSITFAKATLVDGETVNASVSVAATGGVTGKALPIQFAVDGQEPKLTLLSPSGTVTQAQDVDGSAAGIQVKFTAKILSGVDANTALSVVDGANVIIPAVKGLTANAQGEVTFPGNITLANGAHALAVKAQRKLGNLGGSPTSNVTVSTTTPVTINLTAPTFTTCSLANSITGAPANTCGVEVRAAVSANVTSVTFTGSGAPTAPVTPTAGVAIARYNVAQGRQVLTATATDGTQSANATVTLNVDTIAPTLVFATPAAGATLTGQSQTVTVTTTGAENGQSVSLRSSGAGGGPLATATVSGVNGSGVATVTFSNVQLPVGAQTLTASVSDAVGNAATPATVAVTVTVPQTQCDLTLTTVSGKLYGTADTTALVPGPGRSIQLEGSTTRCKGQTVSLFKRAATQSSETPMGTVTADATTGAFSGLATLIDGEVDSVFVVKVGAGTTLATANITYSADFTAPTISALDPEAGSFTIVASTDPRAALDGFVPDEDPATAGGQLAATVAYAGAGRPGSSGNGSVTVTRISDGTVLASDTTLTSDAAGSLPVALSFPDGAVGELRVVVKDAAGNSATASWNVTVNTTGLATPTLTQPTAGAVINVASDQGGDRATFAVAAVNIDFGRSVEAGSSAYLCSTVQLAGGAACTGGGFELPGSRGAVSGSSKLFSTQNLPQGAQSLTAVLVDSSGAEIRSAAVAITVDTVSPSVSAVVATADTAAPAGILGATEWPSGTTTPITATVTGVEDGAIAHLFAAGVDVAQAAVSGGSATFALPDRADGDVQLEVRVTDAAGNSNIDGAVSPAVTNSAAGLSLSLLRSAPFASRTAPATVPTVCNAASDELSGTTACDLTFTVAVGSSVVAVDFSGDGLASTQTVAPTSGSASFQFPLPEGTGRTLRATARDAAGNSTVVEFTVATVDTTLPLVSFTSPTANQQFATQQLTLVLSTPDAAGGTVSVTSSANAQVVASGSVDGSGSTTLSATVPDASPQTLTAVVTDAAGNVSAAGTVVIDVSVAGCGLVISSPANGAVLNASQAPGGVVALTGAFSRSACFGQPVTLSKGGTVVATVTSSVVDGSFGTNVTFGDGEAGTVLDATNVFAGSTNSAQVSVSTDFTGPTISSLTPVAGTLFIVAPSNNLNVANGVAGYVAAQSAGAGLASFPFSMQVSGAGDAFGSANGRLRVFQGGALAYVGTVSGNGAQTLNDVLSLSQGFTGGVTIELTDAAGNVSQAYWTAVVDAVAPATPVLGAVNVINSRTANVDVALTIAPDDSPSGYAATYTAHAISELSLGTTTFDEAFFGSGDARLLTATVAGSALQLRGITTLNRYRVGIQGVDGVGNVGGFVTNGLGPAIDLFGTPAKRLPINLSGTGAGFGGQIAVGGDVNGDGKVDAVISAPFANGNLGQVVVLFGGNGLPSVAIDGTVAGGTLGRSVALGDLNRDGRADLIVAGATKVFVYLSTLGQLPSSPSFEIQVPGTGANANVTLLPDLDGDGSDELVIGAFRANSSTGEIKIFKSRLVWLPVEPYANADITIAGSVASGQFGRSGSLRGQPDGSLTVKAGGVGQLLRFSASKLRSSSALTVADADNVFSNSGSPTLFGTAATMVDLDADGRLDMVVGDSSRSMVFGYLQAADGSFPVTGSETAIASGANGIGQFLARGDFNLDGKADLFAASTTVAPGSVGAVMSSASGLSGGFGVNVAKAENTYGTNVALWDYNADGKVDLVVASPSGESNGYVEIFE